MVSLTLAFAMKPLGVLVCGGMAALGLGMAAILYLRLRAAWYAAMGLLALSLAWDLVGGLLVTHAAVLVIAVGCLIGGGVALYLWYRRPWFLGRDVQRPRLSSAPGICALVIVLGLGGLFLLDMTVDDARQSFPALEVQVPVPPEQQNGYLLLEKMPAQWPLRKDKQFGKLMDEPWPENETPSSKWLAEARPLLRKYAGCLEQAQKLAKEPHFMQVPRHHGTAWVDRSMQWLEFARRLAVLLSILAETQVADGHWNQAFRSADTSVELGVLLESESTRLIQTLVGNAILQIGLSSMQQVAGSVPDAGILKAHLGSPVPEGQFREGFNLGLAGDFRGRVGETDEMANDVYRALRSMRAEWQPGSGLGGFLQKQMSRLQSIKPNMSHNVLGRITQPWIIHGAIYAPPAPDRMHKGLESGSIVRAFGLLHVIRNPIGDFLAAMPAPVLQRAAQNSFDVIAESRMTRLFIALRCYQLEHGTLPASLNALAPQYLKAIPVDPFTGKAFGYEPGGAKPRIWSVGPDRTTGKSLWEGGDDVAVDLSFAETKPAVTGG